MNKAKEAPITLRDIWEEEFKNPEYNEYCEECGSMLNKIRVNSAKLGFMFETNKYDKLTGKRLDVTYPGYICPKAVKFIWWNRHAHYAKVWWIGVSQADIS